MLKKKQKEAKAPDADGDFKEKLLKTLKEKQNNKEKLGEAASKKYSQKRK